MEYISNGSSNQNPTRNPNKKAQNLSNISFTPPSPILLFAATISKQVIQTFQISSSHPLHPSEAASTSSSGSGKAEWPSKGSSTENSHKKLIFSQTFGFFATIPRSHFHSHTLQPSKLHSSNPVLTPIPSKRALHTLANNPYSSNTQPHTHTIQANNLDSSKTHPDTHTTKPAPAPFKPHPHNLITKTKTSFTLISSPRSPNLILPTMPFKQLSYILTTPKFEPLIDLTLSLIAYNILARALYLGLISIAWLWLSCNHINAISDRRKDLIEWITLSLWTVRFLLRYRRHLMCVAHWLCPLFPQPFEACLCCWRSVE